MSTKEKYASGDYVTLKGGGPRMRVKWYIGPTKLETSWGEGRNEKSGQFDENEIEPYELYDGNGIYNYWVNAEEL